MLNKVVLLLLIFSCSISFASAEDSKKIDIPNNANKTTDQTNFRANKIAVVDVQTILDLSTAVSGIRASVEKISQNLQNEFTETEVALKKIEAELIGKESSLSKEEFEKEVMKFNIKVTAEQKKTQERKIKLEQAHSKAISKVNEVAMKIIRDIAEQNNLNIILPSTQVLYADEKLNITEKVLYKLNETIPSVEIRF